MSTLTKAQVNAICALHHKKDRDEQGLYVAEGDKLIGDLIAGGAAVMDIYTSSASQFATHAKATIVAEQYIAKISAHKSLPASVAVFKKPTKVSLKDASGLMLYLSQLQDPGNVGTIIRTADWFGVKHIILSADSADAYGPKTVQATMGSIARSNIYVAGLNEALAQLPSDTKCYATMLDGEPLPQISLAPNALIVIGNEGSGISESSLPSDAVKCTIPRYGNAESLNAAVATAVILGYLRMK
jgi:RNA methyltransferase, TrmH family